jgi:hypothetical protein
MKRAYLSPVVTDLGSVSEMTRAMGGAYGEFIANGEVGEGMNMRMRMRMNMGGDH